MCSWKRTWRKWAALLLVVLCLPLSGCTRRAWMQRMGISMDKAYQQGLDDLMAALNARDAVALRGLFAPNVQSAVSDEAIAALLAFTEGKNLRAEWSGNASGGESRSDGKITRDVNESFTLYVDDVPYRCWINLTYRCDTDAGEVGVHRIRLVSDYVLCAEDYPYPEGEALQVLVETGDDYQTRRIGDVPYIWTDTGRIVPEADLLAFLQPGVTMADVQSAFGTPQRQCELFCIYQLEDGDGGARYATIYGRLDEPVQSAVVSSGTKYLYDLWRAPAE